MKSVLISIQPKWCELIASGKKTVEVRKTRPKIDTPFKCFIYCTQGKDVLAISRYDDKSAFLWEKSDIDRYNADMVRNGKVIGEFVCDDFTYIEAGYDTNGNKHLYNTAFIEHRMCIPDLQLFEYLYKSREKCGGWAWHISDLVIYDKPKELSEFYRRDTTYDNAFAWAFEDRAKNIPIKRPPQSWCYVEEVKEIIKDNSLDTVIVLDETAIVNALKKQIPKKPILKYHKEEVTPVKYGRLIEFLCPNCGRFIVATYETDVERGGGIHKDLKGCSTCLQAIDFTGYYHIDNMDEEIELE